MPRADSSPSRTCRSPSSPAPAEIPAVMNFSASVAPGQALGLVGESGCGKSTVALAVMRDLGKTGRIVGGSIRFKGRELTTMSRRRAAPDPRLRDRHDLPGADGEPEPGDEGRPAAHGSADDPRGRQRGRRPRPGAARGRGGAPARPEAHPRQLPAPALRRPAAAHRHRHGADVEALAPDPRRADDRARRDRRGRASSSWSRTSAASSAPRCSSSATTSAWCSRPATGSA